MKSILHLLIAIFLICSTNCCSQRPHEISDWKGGAVREEGIYHHYSRSFVLNVYVENNLLKYVMIDSVGRVLFRNGPIAASVFHNWAFYLDDKRNLWCFSSDFGHVVWKFNASKAEYSLVKLYHKVDRRDVPESLYNELREFFD